MGGSRRERKGSVEGKDNMLEHSITSSHQIKGGVEKKEKRKRENEKE